MKPMESRHRRYTLSLEDITDEPGKAHGAVVAREHGLPAIVDTRNGTAAFRTGDRILLDGVNGIVRIAGGEEMDEIDS
jgi:phosphoenolpyruvate-protein kinase (PTS system EI component)